MNTKRLMIIILTLTLIIMFTGCGSGVKKEISEKNETQKTVIPTDEDFEELKEMASIMFAGKIASIDCESSLADEVIDYLIPGDTTEGYDYYFDDAEYINANSTDEKYKINGENLDWIIENIFHISPSHDNLKNNKYYEDGYYYIPCGDAGQIIPDVSIEKYEPIENGAYDIELLYYYDYDDPEYNDYEKMEITAELKEIDGKRF